MAKPADYVVDNDTGANVRTDLNNLFEAIRQNNGYGDEPTTKYNYMWYANTAGSSPKMSFYKSDATNRVEFISLANGNFFGPNGSASDPSYTFTNSASTGFYRSASNQIGVSNNSVNTALFKTTGTEIKGKLEVAPTSGNAAFDIKTSGNSNDSAINLIADTTHTTAGFSITRKSTANGSTELVHQGTGSLIFQCQTTGSIDFVTNKSNTSTTNHKRWEISGAAGSEGSFISNNSSISNALTHAGAAFHINGDTFEGLSLVKNNYGWGTPLFIQLLNASGSRNLLEFKYNTSSSGTGTAVGFISTNGSTTTFDNGSSDRSMKKNFESWNENTLDLFKNINPQKFNFIHEDDTTEKTKGFIAQDLTESFPEAYHKGGGSDTYKFNPSGMVVYLMKALQEAVVKIETLEAKVAVLEGS